MLKYVKKSFIITIKLTVYAIYDSQRRGYSVSLDWQPPKLCGYPDLPTCNNMTGAHGGAGHFNTNGTLGVTPHMGLYIANNFFLVCCFIFCLICCSTKIFSTCVYQLPVCFWRFNMSMPPNTFKKEDWEIGTGVFCIIQTF